MVHYNEIAAEGNNIFKTVVASLVYLWDYGACTVLCHCITTLLIRFGLWNVAKTKSDKNSRTLRSKISCISQTAEEIMYNVSMPITQITQE